MLETQLLSGLALKVAPGERAVAVKVDEVIGVAHRVVELVEAEDRVARLPAEVAEGCVQLLSPAGVLHRGQLWSPGAVLPA